MRMIRRFIQERQPQGAAPDVPLIDKFEIAGFAAGLAVHQAVGADANVLHGLAQAAIFFALAERFQLFALRTTISVRTSACAHRVKYSSHAELVNVTLVIKHRGTTPTKPSDRRF
jgi:hypothetical protein